MHGVLPILSFPVCWLAGRLRGITSFSDMVFGVLREVQRVNLVIQLRYVLSKLLPATPIEVLLAVVHSPPRKDDDEQHMTEAVLRGYDCLANIKAADTEAKVSSEHRMRLPHAANARGRHVVMIQYRAAGMIQCRAAGMIWMPSGSSKVSWLKRKWAVGGLKASSLCHGCAKGRESRCDSKGEATSLPLVRSHHPTACH